MRKRITTAAVAAMAMIIIAGVVTSAIGAPGNSSRAGWSRGGGGWFQNADGDWWWRGGNGWWWDGGSGNQPPPTEPPGEPPTGTPTVGPPTPSVPPPTSTPTPTPSPSTTPPPTPSPSQPPPVGSGVRASISGTWVLVQVTDEQQLQRWSSTISTVLQSYNVRGLSLRVPWDVMTDSLLDEGKAIADAAGKAYSIRVMAGHFTPQWVFDSGSPSYIVNGDEVPTPFFPDGSSNTVFEAAYGGLVSYLADYSRSRGVQLLHLPWYGQDWAELNNGAEVRSQPGYSEAALIAAHERLLDIAIPFSGGDLAIEFPMSGYGPLQNVSQQLTQYIVASVGPNSPRVYVQANGLSPDGDWGAPDPSVEAQMDQAVFSQNVLRGEQMIQPQTYDWGQVFSQVTGNGADYVEIYLESFPQSGSGTLASAIDLFS